MGACSANVSDDHLWAQSSSGALFGESDPRGRRPAAEGPRCYQDRFTPDNLRREILDKQGTVKLPENFRFAFGAPETTGLKASELPAASQLLLSSADNIRGTDSDFGAQTWFYSRQNYAGCTDAACVVNRIYGRDEGPGEKLTWLYLESGYAVAATDRFPFRDQIRFLTDGKRETYLFSEAELDGLTHIAGLLPTSFRRLSSLQTIHRLPRDFGFENLEPTMKNTAAWIYGHPRSGHILTSDSCLRLGAKPFDTGDFFYSCLVHEISHARDRTLAAVPGTSPPLSTHTDWLKLSGWEKESFVDAGGVATIKWTAKSQRPFVSAYSRTLPGEDFAESVTWARLKPEELLRVAPEKHAFLTERVFQGRAYHDDGFTAFVVGTATRGLQGNMTEWMSACTAADAPGSETPVAFSTKLPVPEKILRCLSSRYLEWRADVYASLRYYEPEGCRFLDAHGSRVDEALLAVADPLIEKFLSESRETANFVRLVQEFRTQINEGFDARAEYLACLDSSTPQSCYDSRLVQRFDETLAAAPESVREVGGSERDLFLKTNAWARTEVRVGDFYRNLLAGFESLTVRLAQERWGQCRSQAGTEAVANEELLTRPFSGGIRFVPAPLLRCLNSNASRDFEQTREKLLSSLGVSITLPAAQRWVDAKLLEPVLVRTYQGLLEEALRTQNAEWNELRRKADLGVKERFGSDLEWLAVERPGEACAARLAPLIDADESKLDLLSLADLKAAWIRESCEKLMASPAARSSVNRVQTEAFEKELAPLLKDLDRAVLTAAAPRIKECRRGLQVFRRSACLSEAWTSITALPVRDFLTSDLVQKLRVKYPNLADSLSTRVNTWVNRPALREQAERLLESR